MEMDAVMRLKEERGIKRVGVGMVLEFVCMGWGGLGLLTV